MGNTFGGVPLIDPDMIADERQRARMDGRDFPGLMDANSLMVPSGVIPAHGWLLITRANFSKLTVTSAQQLVITHYRWQAATQTMVQDSTATFNGLYIISARSPWRGAPSDPSAPYLVEIGDARWLLKNRLFEFGGGQSAGFPGQSSYNVRAPAYDGNYNASTVASGIPWTWAQMAQEVWQQMSLLGTWPGLPASYTPTGTPEGWIFTGCSAWDALTAILDHLGLVVTCDLTKSSNYYSIVHYGDIDTAFSALQSTAIASFYQLEDENPIFGGAGWVPATFKCYFHRRQQYAGTEETVTPANSSPGAGPVQWGANLAYVVSVSTGYSGPGITHFWDDFTVRYNENSSPLSADTTSASTIASARMTDWLARITRGGNGEMRQVYSGIRPFVTGSLVDAVTWRMVSPQQQPRKATKPWEMPPFEEEDSTGWVTEIVRDPWNRWLPKCEAVCGPNCKPENSSNPQPPVLAPQFPIYPIISQQVRVTTVAAGSNPYGSAAGLWEGYVEQLENGTPIRDREACYFLDPNNNLNNPGVYFARLMNQYNSTPIYVGETVFTLPQVAIPPNTNVTIYNNGVLVVNIDGGTNTVNIYYVYQGMPVPVNGGNDWTANMDQGAAFQNNTATFPFSSGNEPNYGSLWHPISLHTFPVSGYITGGLNIQADPATGSAYNYALPCICPHGGVIDQLSLAITGGQGTGYLYATWPILVGGGTGYVVGDLISFSGGNPGGPTPTAAQVTVLTETGGVITGVTFWNLASAGTGYAIGNTMTINGDSGTVVAGGAYSIATVTGIGAGGSITTYSITPGNYLVFPVASSTLSTTNISGTGTGATFNYGGGAYEIPPLPLPITSSGGHGTEAMFSAVWSNNIVFRIYAAQPAVSAAPDVSFSRYPGILLYESPLYPISAIVGNRLVIDTLVGGFALAPNAMYWVAVQCQAGCSPWCFPPDGMQIDVIGVATKGAAAGISLPVGTGQYYDLLGPGIALINPNSQWTFANNGVSSSIVYPNANPTIFGGGGPGGPGMIVVHGSGTGDYAVALHMKFYCDPNTGRDPDGP
jgi:hypothetical protein